MPPSKIDEFAEQSRVARQRGPDVDSLMSLTTARKVVDANGDWTVTVGDRVGQKTEQGEKDLKAARDMMRQRRQVEYDAGFEFQSGRTDVAVRDRNGITRRIPAENEERAARDKGFKPLFRGRPTLRWLPNEYGVSCWHRRAGSDWIPEDEIA